MKICTTVRTMTTTVKAPTIIVRGTTVQLRAEFSDFDGEAVTPSSAILRVRYSLNGDEVQADPITMTKNAGDDFWSALWQSAVSSAGVASWTVEGETAEGAISRVDGKIELTAGGANPAPE